VETFYIGSITYLSFLEALNAGAVMPVEIKHLGGRDE
jgi:hypothetical protein